MSDLTISINDIRKAGYCTSGARRWFERHGLDFRDFLANGIAAERLLATHDALGADVVAKVKARADG